MNDGDNTTMDEMTDSLMGELAALVDAGEMAEDEAEAMRDWLING